MKRMYHVVMGLLLSMSGCALYGAAEPMDVDAPMNIHQAAGACELSRVQYLIEQCHADVNTRDNYAHTPLHIAVINGHLPIARYLIEHGADINIKDNDDYTPLHIAVAKDHLPVVQFLVKCGADVNTRGNEGETPLHLAAANGYLPIIQCLFKKRGADVNAKDNNDDTPLCIAVDNGHLPIVRFLLYQGANWQDALKEVGTDQIMTTCINNFLHFLLYSSQLLQAGLMGDFNAAKLAIANNADVNAYGLHGNTPLHLAAVNGNWRTVYHLLTHGSQILPNNAQETALDLALKNHQWRVFGLFLSLTAKDAEKAKEFSTFMGEWLANNTAVQEPPKKKRRLA